MKKIKVAVVLGGRSVEHPVSCASAAGVIAALDADRYEVQAVGITPQGQWVTVDADSAKLAIGNGALPEISADSGKRVVLAADPTASNVVVTDAAGATSTMSDVDVVFPVLHGAFGEDGTIQGLLEMAEVPYVGSGVLASAASMDKEFTKKLLAAEGIPSGDHVVLRRGQELSEEDKQRLGLPVFVKPARAGSSLGITKVAEWSGVPKALQAARAVDPKVIVEAGFGGVRELECGVLERLDGGTPDTTPPLEVLGTGEEGWFDFDAKYLGAESPYDLNPELPAGVAERVRELAVRVFTTLDCSDLARVDFFLTADGEVVVNEINTMPGLTPASGVPQAWANAGLSYEELVTRLIELAVQRGTGLR
ncbi:MAG TPA: D-alanine--D-alanine ligase family protein [Stackebrandtia sp.]|uniref:D-alanine--D-alanine ligase family protein n=1 Tax=Stackebrandtia sp. TaxID=2023065 RepID=UPI002D51C68A|nr:D-alanine--D-alanine ligase family protein [Stackebrandtia sp.]HZE40196.1 D-alanine--D-alanine ligase family protein [Stackebrandtia sp.]